MNPEQLFLRSNYLKLTRSKNIARKKFTLVPGDVICELDKVFDFVDVEDSLSMCKDVLVNICYLSVQYFVLIQVLSNCRLEFIQKDFLNVQNTIDCVMFNLIINE